MCDACTIEYARHVMWYVCLVFSSLVLSCLLPCALVWSILFCSVLFCPVLFCSVFVLVLFCQSMSLSQKSGGYERQFEGGYDRDNLREDMTETIWGRIWQGNVLQCAGDEACVSWLCCVVCQESAVDELRSHLTALDNVYVCSIPSIHTIHTIQDHTHHTTHT